MEHRRGVGDGAVDAGHGGEDPGAIGPAGTREKDVVLALANYETPSVQTFEAIASKLDRNKPVSLLVRRGEWAQFVVIRPNR